jgi:hypothetical protein
MVLVNLERHVQMHGVDVADFLRVVRRRPLEALDEVTTGSHLQQRARIGGRRCLISSQRTHEKVPRRIAQFEERLRQHRYGAFAALETEEGASTS